MPSILPEAHSPPTDVCIFQAGAQAIDVFDAMTGMFRSRVALPITLSPNFRALVSNGKDNRIVAITGLNGDGIAVVDLSSLTDPPAVTWLSEPAPINNVGLPFRQPSSTSTWKTPMLTVRRHTSTLLQSRMHPWR